MGTVPSADRYVDGPDVDHSKHHRSQEHMFDAVDDIRASPTDGGQLDLIVRRPEPFVREELAAAELSVADGVVGDSWNQRPSRRSADGGPHPEMQLNLMNSRAAMAVAGSVDRWSLAGDQLYVDLDLSSANLPAGTRLSIGTAVIEVTAEPHTGCANFSRRFGAAARKFVNSDVGAELNLRGINAKVVQPGTIAIGDTITKR